VSEIVVDIGVRLVRRDGIDIHLAPKAFELLVMLVKNQPNAVSHEQLHAALWPGVHVSETSLAALITQLRKALGDSSGDGRMIRTLHRVGYAFNGGPAAGKNKDVKFLPYHGELRVQYWLGGKDVFAKKGLRPYVGAGGGVAQIDAKLPVTVRDCANKQKVVTDQAFYNACKAGQPGSQGAPLDLDAFKKLGQSFIGLNGGAMYALTPNSGFQLNINLMYMLPTTGQVIEPSLGYVMGL